MPKESGLKGKRVIERLNGHEVVVVVPEKVDYEEGKKKLIAALKQLE